MVNIEGIYILGNDKKFAEVNNIDPDGFERAFKRQKAIEDRLKSYAEESDPLRNEWVYEKELGNPDAEQYKQRWLEKVAEIKARIPLPELDMEVQ